MPIQNILIVISSVLAFVSYIVYIAAILKGKAKPHRTTRFVLVVITVLATASLFSQGNFVAIWLSGVFAFGCILIFLLSIKLGMGGTSKTDIICLVIAIIGIVLWRLTDNPIIALYTSIGADLIGQIPMLIKTYRFPETEVWTFYTLDVIAAILNLSATNHWSISDLAFPIYIILIDSIVVLFIFRPLLPKLRMRI